MLEGEATIGTERPAAGEGRFVAGEGLPCRWRRAPWKWSKPLPVGGRRSCDGGGCSAGAVKETVRLSRSFSPKGDTLAEMQDELTNNVIPRRGNYKQVEFL